MGQFGAAVRGAARDLVWDFLTGLVPGALVWSILLQFVLFGSDGGDHALVQAKKSRCPVHL